MYTKYLCLEVTRIQELIQEDRQLNQLKQKKYTHRLSKSVSFDLWDKHICKYYELADLIYGSALVNYPPNSSVRPHRISAFMLMSITFLF